MWGVGCCGGEPQRDLSDSLRELASLPREGLPAGFQRVEEVGRERLRRRERHAVQGADICKGQGDPAVTLTCPRLPGSQCGRRYSISTPGSYLEDLSLETWFSSGMPMSGNILSSQTRETVANGILWVEARDATAAYPSECRIDPSSVASINVYCSEGEKGHTTTVPHPPSHWKLWTTAWGVLWTTCSL